MPSLREVLIECCVRHELNVQISSSVLIHGNVWHALTWHFDSAAVCCCTHFTVWHCLMAHV